MNEFTFLTDNEKIAVLKETIPKIGKVQAELELTIRKVEQLNTDEADLIELRRLVTKNIEKKK